MKGLDRYLNPLKQRVSLMVGRAVIAVVNDATKAQSLQLTLLAGETMDGVERFQDYGFTSVPHAGAEAVMVSVGGTRSHGIVVACEDRRYRLVGLADGEVALYDDLDQAVHLKRDRLLLTSPHRVQVEAPIAVILSDAVSLGAEGGPAVARVGDTVEGGVITGGSSKVTAA
jgi:phage baseplate assembly protein V